MGKQFLLTLLFVVKALFIFGQPVVSVKDVKGARAFKSRSFTGEALYGYINGGADLYNEYGFLEATVTEFRKAGSDYKVEIYRMKDPEAAFGIFSVSRFRCLYRPDFTQLACQNKYQLQVCKGNFYINIINDSGGEADSSVSAGLAMKLASQIKEEGPDFTVCYQEQVPPGFVDNGYLVKGRLGIQNSAPEIEKFLTEAKNYTAAFHREGKMWKMTVRFQNEQDLDEYLSAVTSKAAADGSPVLTTVWEVPLMRGAGNRISMDIPVSGMND